MTHFRLQRKLLILAPTVSWQACLDVESLFTNIPVDETIENCINDLFANNETVLSKQILKNLNLLPMSRFSHLITNTIAN